MNADKDASTARAFLPIEPRILRLVTLAMCLALVSPASHAATPVCEDAQLRQALLAGGTITVCVGTIYLQSTPLRITRDVVINGLARAGEECTLSMGDQQSRVFEVTPGVTLTQSNLTLTHYSTDATAYAPFPSSAHSGMIFVNKGNLKAVKCSFKNLYAIPDGFYSTGTTLGGVVGNFGGRTEFENCRFEKHRAVGLTAKGGAIYSSNGIVVIRGSQFLGNRAISRGGPTLGGAIYSETSEVLIEDSQFYGNSIQDEGNLAQGFIYPNLMNDDGGGAIAHLSGRLVLRNTLFQTNYVLAISSVDPLFSRTGRGGAIFTEGELEVSGCRLLGNACIGSGGVRGGSSEGGGLYNGGTAWLENTTFQTNYTTGGKSEGFSPNDPISPPPHGVSRGGAIYNGRQLVLIGNKFLTNRVEGAKGRILPEAETQAEAQGGALYNVGSCLVTNNLFQNNAAISWRFSYGTKSPNPFGGGAVHNQSGLLTLVHATFQGNNIQAVQTFTEPKGAAIQNAAGIVELYNCIVANSPSGRNASGQLFDGGGNISSDGTCGFIRGLNSVDPLLAVSASDAKPKPGSPALGFGLLPACPATDILKVLRPVGLNCDSGAYEQDDGPVRVRFEQPDLVITEGTNPAQVRIIRSGPATVASQVDYATQEGTAASDADFKSVSGTLTFDPGQTVAVIEVPVYEDQIAEATETFRLVLSDHTLGTQLAQSTFGIVDEPIRIQFQNPSREVVENEHLVRLTLQRQGAIDFPAAAICVTRDGTAIAGSDYSRVMSTILFLPGQSSLDITVPILKDELTEGRETFFMDLLNSETGEVLDTASIAINDSKPSVPEELRQWMDQGGYYRFSSSGTHLLQRPLIVSRDTILDATGLEVTLDGGGLSRLFHIKPGASLVLSNLSLVRGQVVGSPGKQRQGLQVPSGSGLGGAILNEEGTLLAVNCVFVGNKAVGGQGDATEGGAGSGGAIQTTRGRLTAIHCWFEKNAGIGGGAVPFMAGYDNPGGGAGTGGAIASVGTELHLEDCDFVSNEAYGGAGTADSFGYGGMGTSQGGAIEQMEAPTRMHGCRLNGNQARNGNPANGGAIFQAGSALFVSNSTLGRNQAAGGGRSGKYYPGKPVKGGAIYCDGDLTVERSQLVENTVAGADWDGALGGGIFASGKLKMSQCLLKRNSATPSGGTGQGGGLYLTGDGEATNVTLTENRAHGVFTYQYSTGLIYSEGPAGGGAIYHENGSLKLTHVTIAGNEAKGGIGFGGVFTHKITFGSALYAHTNSFLKLANTLVGRNAGDSNIFGKVMDEGGNLCSDGSAPFTTSLSGIDPKLGPIGDYGAGLATLPLLPGSPAIDAALDAHCTTVDQRGWTRPTGERCDIGAFESHGEFVPDTLLADPSARPALRLLYFGPANEVRSVSSSVDLKFWLDVWSTTIPPAGWFEFIATPTAAEPFKAFRVTPKP